LSPGGRRVSPERRERSKVVDDLGWAQASAILRHPGKSLLGIEPGSRRLPSDEIAGLGQPPCGVLS
jgi:hypothetical protein